MVPALLNGAESLGPLLWSQGLSPREQRAWDRSYGPRVSSQGSKEPGTAAMVPGSLPKEAESLGPQLTLVLYIRQYDNLCC